jgi:GH15 family glucan-1,4-alpha-glucosidase
MAGTVERAERILERCESLAGDLGVFGEEVDVRSGAFLGNTPLLFSHVEYVRARLEVARARKASPKTTSVT